MRTPEKLRDAAAMAEGDAVLPATGVSLICKMTFVTVTDTAAELAGAKFDAFFYNVAHRGGEAYLLYTLSGAPREAF